MAKHPNERYQSAAELGHELREATARARGGDGYHGRGVGGAVGGARTVPDGRPPTQPSPPSPVPSPPPRSSTAAWPIAVGLGAFVAVLIAGLAVWGLTRGSDDVGGEGGVTTASFDEGPGDDPIDGPGQDETPTTVRDVAATGEEPTSTEPSVAVDGPRIGEIDTTTLQPGDCFNAQLNTIAVTVELVDCSEAHTAEVTGVFQSPDAGGAYPGQEQLVSDALPICEGAFATYVGVSPFLTQLTFGGYLPLFEQWTDEGIYQYSCYASRLDGQPLRSGVQGASGSADVAQGFGKLTVLFGVSPGACFRAADATTRLALGNSVGFSQLVILEDCANQHGGQVLAATQLSGPADGLYNAAALEQEALAVCQGLFPAADPQGLLAVIPDTFDWQFGRVGTFCVFLWAQSTTNFFDVP